MSGFWKPSRNTTDDNRRHFSASASAHRHQHQQHQHQQQRFLLPIAKHCRQIAYALEKHSVVVICGETGSGKSTQIPQFLVEYGWADRGFTIVCTEPRRIAATTLATRVAQEVGTPLGEEVGYCVRFDERYSPHTTKILYVTDGILLAQATSHDPLLSQYSVVIVDEAHERTLNSDALLGLLKKIRRQRKDLRVILCSATMDAQAFLDFFVGTGKHQQQIITTPSTTPTTEQQQRPTKRPRWGPPPVTGENHKESKKDDNDEDFLTKGTIISVDGRQHAVDILYAEKPVQNYLTTMIETAVSIANEKEDTTGDILCFLPTGEDVDRCIQMAEERVHHSDETAGKVDFLPLYGTLPQKQQALVFAQQQQGKNTRRRIIFSTNIAETSVTVPNITHVIDCGFVKLPYFDPDTGLERLIIGPISQASARQRAGRAGRLTNGKCYRLYAEEYLRTRMEAHTVPEISRTNLTSFILTLKALGVDNILAFDLMDPPSVDSLAHGLESLYALGAMDEQAGLTSVGWDMSAFPTDVRVAKMLLESLSAGCSYEVLGVASALQVRDLWQRPRQRREQAMIDYTSAMNEVADPSGDHVTYVNILSAMDDYQWSQQDCRDRFVNYMAVKRAMEIRKQLSRVLRRFGKVEALGVAAAVADDEHVRSQAIRRCVTAGFFFNVAKLSNDGRYYTIRRNVPVTPANSSVYHTHSPTTSEYIIFGETIDGSRGGIELKSVSMIEARWLRELAPHYWK